MRAVNHSAPRAHSDSLSSHSQLSFTALIHSSHSQARREYTRSEFLVACLHVGVTAIFGMSLAVALALLLINGQLTSNYLLITY